MNNISIILPVFNGMRTISNTLESILVQTYSNFEVLVIDDGSTDDTLAIVTGFSDPRIKIIRNKRNLGLIPTLNKGLDLACGKYIARMDADDVMHPNRLKIQYEFMESHPGVDICGAFMNLKSYGKKIGIIQHGISYDDVKAELLFNSPIPHPLFFIRTERIGSLRYNESYKYCEDYEFLSNFLIDRVGRNIPKYLLDYNVVENSQTRIGEELSTDRFEKITSIQKRLLIKDLRLPLNSLNMTRHYQLCLSSNMSKIDDLNNAKTITEIHHYFEELLIANKVSSYCSNAALQNMLGKIWMKLVLFHSKNLSCANLLKMMKSKYFYYGLKASVKYIYHTL